MENMDIDFNINNNEKYVFDKEFFIERELEEVDGDGPTRQQEQSIKRVLDKYSNKAMFNTPSGKASGPLQKFADDESLEDMAISGVM